MRDPTTPGTGIQFIHSTKFTHDVNGWPEQVTNDDMPATGAADIG